MTAFMPISRLASMVFLVCLNTAAQELVLRNIHVEKKPGQESGPVMATVNGKPRRILPEILYPPGTELLVELTAPLITSEVFPSNIPAVSGTPAEREQILTFVRALPFRTATRAGNKPSDLTNLLFLGPPEGLQRAFQAAGWVNVDQLTAASHFQTLKSVAGDEGYSEAPMSTLLLYGRPPIFTLSKTTNTFSARHHLRVFDPSMQYQGLPALTSSSTQDIGIAFSRKQKNFHPRN